jgi:hypothetical protein
MSIGYTHVKPHYDAICEDCRWSKGLSLSPPFRSVRKHVRETAHKVIVKKWEEWEYGELDL